MDLPSLLKLKLGHNRLKSFQNIFESRLSKLQLLELCNNVINC
jgi:hypothetical protein